MKFYICNLGCKVNTYESNVMSETLIKDGYKEVTSEEAELVIVNTCSVTDVALKKSLKMIRRFNNLKKLLYDDEMKWYLYKINDNIVACAACKHDLYWNSLYIN